MEQIIEDVYVDFELMKTIEEAMGNNDELNLKLEENFKTDITLFLKVLFPIMIECYNFNKNPIGLNKIVKLDTVNEKKNFRIIRNDTENLDLLMSKEEIEKLILTLKELLED